MNFPYVSAILLVTLFPFAVVPTGPYSSLDDIFQGALANLSTKAPGDPAIGGQDFGLCCAKAVNQSLMIDNGDVVLKPGQTFLNGNISMLMSYQFPCTASYNGSDGDQPQVNVPYSWCRNNCNGWQRTESSITSDWVEPFIGFILPTVVFCYTIPRRRSITLPQNIFPSNSLLEFPGNLTLLYKLPIAGFLMVFDTIQWLIVCIVMSGPMLFSGLLEALLDSRILQYLSEDRSLSPRKRAQLLILVLIGNLDEEPAWRHSMEFVSLLEDDGDANEISPTLPGEVPPPQVLIPLVPIAPAQTEKAQNETKFDESESPRSWEAKLHNQTAGRRLISLLESQASFGTSIGIGVLFFLSSFFYSIESIRASWGDGGTAHSLAFGCFWMTLGHTAVVGGVLLAGNNPSAWEAAVVETELTKERPPWQRNLSSFAPGTFRRWSETALRTRRISLPEGFKEKIYRSGFSSRYKTAWMWNRGSTKAMWIARVSEAYPQLDLQTKVLRLSTVTLLLELTGSTLLLFFIPAFLGGMVSYVTPTVGLSCRSMVPLLYTSAQGLLVLLWVVDLRFWKRTTEGKVFTKTALQDRQTTRILPVELAWYFFFILAVLMALVSSIGGTAFHLMGLFSNCLCWIPLKDWRRRWSADVTMSLASDSENQIWTAQVFWIPIGVTATLFLAFTTYIGWQYQHRLRAKFTQLAAGIGQEARRTKDSGQGAAQSISFKEDILDRDHTLGVKRDEFDSTLLSPTEVTNRSSTVDTISTVYGHS